MTKTRYENVTDKTVHGLDITIWERDTGLLDVDIKKPCGEIIHHMEDFDEMQEADYWAMGFVDGYVIARRAEEE